jgi:low temperature requirement protein LtrA
VPDETAAETENALESQDAPEPGAAAGPEIGDQDERAAEPEKRVGWAELFFDLVFVVAVTRVSTFIEQDGGWPGLLRALVVFVPIYWMWVGTAVQTNQSDISRPALRLKIFAVALAGVFMALSLDEAYGDRGLLFAISYWAARVLLGWRILGLGRRLPLNPYSVSMFITGPLLVVGALLPGDWRLLVWGVAALLDLSTPTLLRRQLRGMHFDAGHLAERFGLFVLIAVGESLVAVASSSPKTLTVLDGAAVAAAFAVSVGLWWVYFHFAADAVRYALATATVQLNITRTVLSYGHLLFIGAIIVISVGLHDALADPSHHLTWPVAGLLYGGTALYLATFGLTRWAMFRLVSTTRLGAAGVVLLVMLAVPHVPALVALVMLAVVLAGLNMIELMRVGHIGWRALLGRRAQAQS